MPMQVETLRKAMALLHHRGPDDAGYQIYDVNGWAQLMLAHTRLSIIDLSDAAHQPMVSKNERYTVVYNGEIYNYKELKEYLIHQGCVFLTESDTEVLLESWIHWGEACLTRLKGMFSFVVYDKQEHILTCVRDAFGIKPFYYTCNEQEFLFASELPALRKLLQSECELNYQKVYEYLVYGHYDTGDETMLQGVMQLPPGHLISIDLNDLSSLNLSRWWWPEVKEREGISFDEAAEQLRELFLDNVRLHLRSDVSLGAALSGGLDSSAVVCAIRYLDPDMPIHTFSYIAEGTEVNEEDWVDMVNDYVSAVPHKVRVHASELIEDLNDMVKVQGEPFGSTSIYAQYRVFQLAKQSGITVTLDGQGADELLAGYNGFPAFRMRSMLERGQVLKLVRFLKAWSLWPGRSYKQGLFAFLGSFLPVGNLRTLALKFVGRDPLPSWLNVEFLKQKGVVLSNIRQSSPSSEFGRRVVSQLRANVTGEVSGLSSLLRHGDRNSMRWSIESRVPFLTIEMAEFLLSLPEEYLISPEGETKHVFRAAMRGIVPDEILDRKDKVGFATPEKEWLRDLQDEIFVCLESVKDLPCLNIDACKQELLDVLDERKSFTFTLWRVINVCFWAQALKKEGVLG